MEKVAGVDEVQYSEQWLDQFEGLLYVLKVAGLAIGGLLCVAVLFIITNTIKLAIYSRRNEIEIYKLVGATDWYVKAPLLIEGALQGLLGALIALGILLAIALRSLFQGHSDLRDCRSWILCSCQRAMSWGSCLWVWFSVCWRVLLQSGGSSSFEIKDC